MDLSDIKRIVDLMKTADLTAFELEKRGFKLRLARKEKETAPAVVHAAGFSGPALPTPTAEMPATPSEAPSKEPGIEIITSPMVGTFYQAPSPESPAFTKVGDEVGVDSVVGIIEAMKVMNEIQAEIGGTITEVLVANGDAVEYGQPLFKVKTTPSSRSSG